MGRLIEVLAHEHQPDLYTDPNIAFHRPWRASLKTTVFQRYWA